MKTIKNYNIYLFITTFTRNIIDVYSIIYLYKVGFSFKNIILIYAMVYLFGYFISLSSMIIGNKIGYKYILILSSIFTSITFYIIHYNNNLFLISLFLSLSMFTYHPIRHYFGIKLLKSKKEIGNTLIYIYIATILSSYIAMKVINITYLIIVSIISIIPIIFIKNNQYECIKYHRINNNKLIFFIFDQFRIIFLLLEPLYLYMISKTISYVGIFNIILSISSILYLYLLSRKINVNKNYLHINIVFIILLIIKLNTNNKTILLIIALFEGIGIKTNELVSTINLYNNNYLDIGYIINCEKFFCTVRILLLGIIYIFSFNIKISLYILLVGMFLLSFMHHSK